VRTSRAFARKKKGKVLPGTRKEEIPVDIDEPKDDDSTVQQRYRETANGETAVDRYNKSDKGKASRQRYWKSDKGKLTRKKYYESGKGQEGYQRRQEESKELRKLLKWVSDNPDRDPKEFYSQSDQPDSPLLLDSSVIEDDWKIDIEVQKEGEEVNLDE
jgi:hypothetical protein